MSFKFLTIERDASIATLCLNRPDCGNALSLNLMQEIIDAIDTFKYDTSTRVIIFCGAGKHFSVGADLKVPARQSHSEETDLLKRSRETQLGRELIEAILRINQITLAAVQGAAAGGAACIASACDFRVGSQDCRIGYPEVKLGMNLSWGALPLCYNLVGPAVAKRLVIGGELESASDLLAWGFLDEVVEGSALQPRARELAEFYSLRPPLAAQMIKHSINALQMAATAGVMHADGDQFTLASLSDDYRQAREEFLVGREREKNQK